MPTLNWKLRSAAIESGQRDLLEQHLKAGWVLAQIDILKAVDTALVSDSDILMMFVRHASPALLAEVLRVFASEDDRTRQARCLVEAGVPVDIKLGGQTALQLAVGNSNPKMVHLLLRLGADPKASGDYGTALEQAEKHSDPCYQGMMHSALGCSDPAMATLQSPYDYVDLDEVKQTIARWASAIQDFAGANSEQVFYVVALDGSRLRANSQQSFAATLASYQASSPERYREAKQIEGLRFSVGDFSFSIASAGPGPRSTSGFSFDMLERRVDDNRTKGELLADCFRDNLEGICGPLQRSSDFVFATLDHTY